MRHRLTIIASGLVLLALLVAPGFLLGTAVGARWLAQAAEARLPLEFAGVEGSFLRGLRVERFAYRDARTTVAAEDLRLHANLRCVLRSAVCVTHAGAQRVTVAVAPAPDDRVEDADPLAVFAVLPSLWIDNLQVGILDIAVAGDRHQLRDVHLGGSASRAGVLVDRLHVCHELACGRGAGAFSAEGRWEAEGGVEFAEGAVTRLVDVEGLALPGAYRFTAAGTLGDARVRLTSPPVPEVVLQASARWAGPLALSATLDGIAILAPQVTASPWLALRGPLDLELRREAEDRWRMDLRQNLAGYGTKEEPLAVSLGYDGTALELTGASLGAGEGTRVRARGKLGPPDALQPDLRFEFLGLDLPEATGVPLRAIRGSAGLTFDLRAPLEQWAVVLEDLAFAEGERRWRGSGALEATAHPLFPRGELRVELLDPALAPGDPLRLQYRRPAANAPAILQAPDGMALGDVQLSALELSLAPQGRDDLRVRARSEGDLATDLEVSLRETGDGARGVLEPFRLRWQDVAVRSPQATEFAWIREAGALRLGPFCLRVRSSEACSAGADLGPSGSLDLALTINERLEDLVGDDRFSVEARGPGALALRWSDWTPQAVRASADLTRLALDPFVGLATAPPIVWETARFEGHYEGGAGRLVADLASSTAGSLSGDIAVAAGGRLEGRVSADELVLSALTDFVPELSVQAGSAAADLSLAGTLEAPEVTGTAAVREAFLRLDSLDSELDDLNLEARLDGRTVEVQGEARLGGGALGLEAVCCEGDRLTGTLIGSRNRLRLPVGLDALFSPSLDIAIAPSELTVTGSLAVHEGVFEHSALEEGGVAVSPDVRRLDTPDEGAQRFDLSLDLRTLIEPGFVLRSRQLESILSGDLRLIMAPRTPPSLFGNLEVLGGELRAFGQALRLTEGSLGFVGDPLNPDLAISAEREIRTENQRVGFRVRGTLEEPLFELFSDPQRSNDETLSYLLRGRGPDVGVSADGTAMALSLGASAVNQSGVLASLNSVPGLSGVTLGAEGTDQDMAATISAYVGNRLYLSYGVGIYEPVNALTARLFLRSRLWLEVVSRLESSFDLYYRFDRN